MPPRIARLYETRDTCMQLPRHVDPRKFCAQGVRLQGFIPAAELTRLATAAIAAGERVEVELDFSQDAERRCILEGRFSLTATLQCQRCLGPYDEELQEAFCFAIVWDEERAAVLPKRLDPWLVAEESADLYELVEDEILLSLPIVAFHPEDSCPREGSYSTGEAEQSRENPFNILAQLKK